MKCFGLAVLLFSSLTTLHAQDAFEIQVYEYETVPKGMWNLETHANYTGRGTRQYEGTVAPTDRQFHLTYELTRGITNDFEMAGYLVLAGRPGLNDLLEYAAVRLRPRYSIPKSVGLPVDISISGEVGFPRKVYEENSMTLELRPILEKKMGLWQLDFNPTFARALRGPGKSAGWEWEPAVRLAYKANQKLDVTIEYYGATGPIHDPYRLSEQGHVFFPGCDIQLSERVVWNMGIGMAATHAGDQLVFKMRLGVLFGKKKG
jgi:hypothetical protein